MVNVQWHTESVNVAHTTEKKTYQNEPFGDVNTQISPAEIAE